MTTSTELVPMNPDDPMIRSGARWCATHGRWECAARVDREHHAPAIRGMKHCRHHVGRSTAMAKALGEANLQAWSTEYARGDEVPLDPGTVVLQQLRVAVMRADLYGDLLRWQVEVDEEAGLVGVTHTAGRDGARLETGEQPRAMAKLEAEWRDRVVRFAKTAHDMGIAERHVELEQERASLVTSAFRAALSVVQLLPADRTAMVERFLSELGVGAVAGEVTS